MDGRSSVSDVLRRVGKFCRRYGLIGGIQLWYRLRQHVGKPTGELHEFLIPGLKHPIALRVNTSDFEVFHRIFIDGELDFDLRKVPTRIVDAGANIGLASLYLLSRFPHARILALEIEDSNFALLRRNTSAYPNVTCLKMALWSGAARLGIANPTDEHWMFRVTPAASDDAGGVPAVGVKDLMELFEGKHIDLLKIDIEGAEKQVFQDGADEWIDQVDTIAVELHDRFEPGCEAALAGSLENHKHEISMAGEYTVVRLNQGSLSTAS